MQTGNFPSPIFNEVIRQRGDNYQGYVVYECRVRADNPAQAYQDSLTYLREC